MKNMTKKQLAQVVSERAVDFYQAQAITRRLRERLNAEYSVFFRATGEPEPSYRRIDPGNPLYAPVIAYTADTYELYRRARSAKNNAKRRMEAAIRALIGPNGSVFDLPLQATPKRAPVRRFTDAGVTIQ